MGGVIWEVEISEVVFHPYKFLRIYHSSWFGLVHGGQDSLNFQIIKKFHGYFTVVFHVGLVWFMLGKDN